VALALALPAFAPLIAHYFGFVRAGLHPTGFLVYDTPYWLPGASEPLTVATGQLDRLAFAADESKDRGPCDELWMNRLMQVNGCIRGKKCPCPDSERSCAAGSIVEITAVLPVVVLHDEEQVLQGLRDELRPASADVDGFLGADVVKLLVLDVDYIHNRLIFRCADPIACKTTIRIPDLDHQPPP